MCGTCAPAYPTKLDSVTAYVDHIAVEMYHCGGVSDLFADDQVRLSVPFAGVEQAVYLVPVIL